MHRKQSRFPWSPGGAARRDRLHAAAKAKKNQQLSEGRGVKGCQNSDNLIERVDTKKDLAKIAGMSHDTIARGELALKRKHIIAAKAKENQGARTDICQNSDKSSIDTKKELAKIAGVSHDTIARVEKIVQKAPEEVLVPKTRPHIMPYPADLLSPGLLTPPANGRA